jgi:hypothetical protein
MKTLRLIYTSTSLNWGRHWPGRGDCDTKLMSHSSICNQNLLPRVSVRIDNPDIRTRIVTWLITVMKVRLCDLLAVCEIPTPLTFERLNQSLWNLVCTSCHLSPLQRRTTEILPISLCVCMCCLSLLVDSLTYLLRGLSRQANYTEWATAACRGS